MSFLGEKAAIIGVMNVMVQKTGTHLEIPDAVLSDGDIEKEKKLIGVWLRSSSENVIFSYSRGGSLRRHGRF